MANYLLVKLTNKKVIKAVKIQKYFILTQSMLEVFLNLFYTTQIVKFLLDNNIINYIISFANITNKLI